MAGRVENGIILNVIKYEAVEAQSDDATICEQCALSELCEETNFDPCGLFEGIVHFRFRR